MPDLHVRHIHCTDIYDDPAGFYFVRNIALNSDNVLCYVKEGAVWLAGKEAVAAAEQRVETYGSQEALAANPQPHGFMVASEMTLQSIIEELGL